MAITRPDGSVFKPSGTLQTFNPSSNTQCLFNNYDQEIIKISGTPIYYFELFIQPGGIDPIYREDKSKLYSNIPVELYGMYEPAPSVNMRTVMGIDGMAELVIDLNYDAVLQALGHVPVRGSRIYTPHKGENWKIIQINGGEYKMWGEIRMQFVCEKWREDATIGEGKVAQPMPDFQLHPSSNGCNR